MIYTPYLKAQYSWCIKRIMFAKHISTRETRYEDSCITTPPIIATDNLTSMFPSYTMAGVMIRRWQRTLGSQHWWMISDSINKWCRFSKRHNLFPCHVFSCCTVAIPLIYINIFCICYFLSSREASAIIALSLCIWQYQIVTTQINLEWLCVKSQRHNSNLSVYLSEMTIPTCTVDWLIIWVWLVEWLIDGYFHNYN